MNKTQKRKQIKVRRLEQKENTELNRALTMMHEVSIGLDVDVIALCQATSSRVLKHLAKEVVELPEGVSLVNKIHEAAQNELVERTVLKAKGYG